MPKALYGALYKLKEYEKTGTAGEFGEAMERQKAKEPVKDKNGHKCCPCCGWIVYTEEYGGRYLTCCENCGQAVLWEGGKNETTL